MVKCELSVVIVLGSLLWAGTGLSVLAVAIHEHTDHSDHHDHLQAFRTALHGHSHEGAPEHDHEPTARSAAGTARVVVQPLTLDYSPHDCIVDRPVPVPCDAEFVDCVKEDDPPPYLMLGVFLT